MKTEVQKIRMDKVDYLMFHYRRAFFTIESAIEDLRKKFPCSTIVKVDSEWLQDFRDNEYHFRVYLQ